MVQTTREARDTTHIRRDHQITKGRVVICIDFPQVREERAATLVRGERVQGDGECKVCRVLVHLER